MERMTNEVYSCIIGIEFGSLQLYMVSSNRDEVV